MFLIEQQGTNNKASREAMGRAFCSLDIFTAKSEVKMDGLDLTICQVGTQIVIQIQISK